MLLPFKLRCSRLGISSWVRMHFRYPYASWKELKQLLRSRNSRLCSIRGYFQGLISFFSTIGFLAKIRVLSIGLISLILFIKYSKPLPENTWFSLTSRKVRNQLHNKISSSSPWFMLHPTSTSFLSSSVKTQLIRLKQPSSLNRLWLYERFSSLRQLNLIACCLSRDFFALLPKSQLYRVKQLTLLKF